MTPNERRVTYVAIVAGSLVILAYLVMLVGNLVGALRDGASGNLLARVFSFAGLGADQPLLEVYALANVLALIVLFSMATRPLLNSFVVKPESKPLPDAPAGPRVFISHSSKDNAFGVKLAADLRARLGNISDVFYDSDGHPEDEYQDGLLGGDKWVERLEHELTARDVFVVILSPPALASRWVKMEIYTALAQELGSKGLNKSLVPVVHETTEAGAFLSQYQWVSFLPGRSYGAALTELEAAVRLGRSRMREVAAGSRELARPPFDLGELPATDHFVGRESDLRWIAERLIAQSDADQNIVAIAATNGLPGIGKSALAAMAARRLFSTGAFPDGIAVVRCNDLTNPVDALQRTLARFDSAQQMPTESDLAALGAQLRQKLNGKRVLIVLDNIEPGWPVWEVTQRIRATGAALLLTSRQELPTTAVPMGASRMLELLDEDQALEVFAENFGLASAQKLTKEQRAKALRIITALGRHTLAVKLVATSLAREPRDWQAVADEYEKKISLALELKENMSEEEAAHARAAVAVGQSLQESVNSLPKRARDALISWSAFATPDFGRQAALAAAGSILAAERDQRGALSEVVGWRLAETWVNQQMPEKSDRERVRLHPLVHAFARERLAEPDTNQRQAAYTAVASWYASYTNATPDLALIPDEANIRGALEWAHAIHEDRLVSDLANAMRGFWRDTGRTHDGLTYLPWGVEAAERIAAETRQPLDQRRAANIAVYYGDILSGVGRLLEAEKAYQRDLALRQQIADRPGIGIALARLGQIAQNRRRLEEAQTYFEQALAINREVHDRREEGANLGNLGQIAQAREHLEEAERYFRQALAIDREVQDRQGEGVDLSYLGQIALQQMRLEVAGDYFQQSLVINREVQDRQGEGANLAYLALLAVNLGQYEQAESYYRAALALTQETEDASNIASMSVDLGRLLIVHRNKRDEGCQLLAEAARVYDQMGVPGAEEAREIAGQLGCGG
jgi:tetratricopeptide (TPR) repeat protein